MQLSICDVCGIPIKPNDEKYAMVVQKMTKDETKCTDAWEYMQNMQHRCKQIQVKEVCQTCKKIYDRFFQLRKDEITKLNEEIEKSYQDPKLLKDLENVAGLCGCLDPDPIVKDGYSYPEKILCAECGKPIDFYKHY